MALKEINRHLTIIEHKLGIVEADFHRHDRLAHHFRLNATHAHEVAEQLERRARRARHNGHPAFARGLDLRANRAHGRAENRSARAEYQRDKRAWRGRQREFLDELEDTWEARKIRWIKNHPQQEVGDGKLDWFDGKQCADGWGYWLKKARENGWNGYLVSGWRSPEFSTSLCWGMCNAPTCSGMCAGAGSNHSKYTFAEGGAVDVSDYYTFAAVLREIGCPAFNDLPNDRVHFSITGR